MATENADNEEASLGREERKAEVQPDPRDTDSPETRYMPPGRDELGTSPYDKNVSSAEIKERINQSLHMHKDVAHAEQRQFARSAVNYSPSKSGVDEVSLSPGKGSLYRINQLQPVQNRSPGKRVLSQAIYEEFDANSSYSQKMLLEANSAGARNLATTAIRNESPFKYDRMPGKTQPAGFRRSPPRSLVVVGGDSNTPAGPPNASQEILSRVFDGNLSIHSPSKKQQEELEHKSLTPSKADILNEERLRTTNTILEKFVETTAGKGNISSGRGAAPTNKNILEDSYEAAVESLGGRLDPNATLDEQVIKLSGCISNMRKDVRLGGVVGVYIMWRTFPTETTPLVVDHVLQTIYTQLIHYESQDVAFLLAALELIGFFGINEISCSSVSIIRAILCTADTGSDLQLTAVNTLVLLGYPGLQVLIELANKDYQQLQQMCILVPELLGELATTDGYRKLTTVAALSRCHSLIHAAGGIPSLVNLLEEGTVERVMLASAIRAAGPQGDSTLIKLLRYHPNSRVRVAVASVMKWRRPKCPEMISFVLEDNEVVSLSKKPLGVMCSYVGPNNPISASEEENKCEGLVQVNPRDFLAALQRLLTMRNLYSEDIQLSHPCSPYQFLLHSFNPYNVEQTMLAFEANQYPDNAMATGHSEERERTSPAVIKALAGALQDEVIAVRETAASSLGTISLPETIDALDALLVATKDPDSNVRAMCAWAIGRLGPNAGTKAVRPLMDLLKDNYWKVKTAACIAVGCLGEQAAAPSMSLLLKILKDGSVNKQITAESIISMGETGVQSLIEFLKREHESNYKTREYIAKALATAKVADPNIDHVIELLFSMAHDRAPDVRKACLISLDKLRIQARDAVTYLKPRHLLPFFYQFLTDPDNGARKCALLCIKSFGAQGELLFIEGVTKDRNPTIRRECAYGLGDIGPSTFRTLLLALHDSSRAVRDAAAEGMVSGMDVASVMDNFRDKPHQKKAIKCAIKEVFGMPYVFNAQTKDFLDGLIQELEKEMEPATSPPSTYLRAQTRSNEA